MNRPRIPEAYRPLHRLAVQQGWSVENTRNGHLRWVSPAGRSVFSPSSPGDSKGPGLLRIRRKLVAAGLEVRKST